MSWLRGWLGRPVLHFVLIGAALYLVASRVLDTSHAAPPPVEISGEALAELERRWIRTAGRPPSPEERERLIAQRVDDELLLREAMRMGWHRSDPVVQRRLVQNQRFLDSDPDATDAVLLERAYAQAMERDDIVVRRRLIERVRLAIGAGARATAPSDAELEAYLAANAEAFAEPARLRVTQVYLSRDLRGDAAAEDARALAERLRTEGVEPDAAEQYGDPLLVTHHLPLWSERSIASRLGPDFARAVMQQDVARWVGPVPSAYGQHVVWVHERVPSFVPELAGLRTRVEASLLEVREKQAMARALARLRDGVDVTVSQ